MSKSTTDKDRLHVFVEPDLKRLIERAAGIQKRTVSGFVRYEMEQAAERVIREDGGEVSSVEVSEE